MDWFVKGLLALAIGLPAVLALALLASAWRLTRLRWRPIALGLAPGGSVPPRLRATLDGARPLLASLGFEFRYTTAAEPALASSPAPLSFSDVWQHADKGTHAIVTPLSASAPDGGGGFWIMWVTQLRSGHVLATVNCRKHTLVAGPAGWLLDDGYLPDAQQSFQYHLQRLPANPEALVRDGVEFFRANKQAIDSFIAQCGKRGMMAPRGTHWQLRWHTALAFAWRLFFGRRRAAKVSAATAPLRRAQALRT